MIWRFGNAEFDEPRRELRISGQVVALETKPLKILICLLHRAGEVVGKEELIAAVWPGVIVVDGSLATAMAKLRKTLGDESQSLIVTVHRVGYQLTGPVIREQARAPAYISLNESAQGQPSVAETKAARTWWRSGPRLALAMAAAAAAAAIALLVLVAVGLRQHGTALDDKSVAVLPLINETGDAGNEYFSDGLSEDLIGSLNAVSGLRVISRHSSFQFKGKMEDASIIGEKLHAASLLEGSVRKQGERVRIAVELVKARDGTTLWSETYDRDLKDIFTVQSEIARAVAGALTMTLLGAKPVPTPPTANFDAYNDFLKGKFYYGRFSAASLRKSIGYYKDAIRLDPRYAKAYAELSVSWSALADQLGGQEAADAYAQSRADAQQALTLDASLWEAHTSLGWVLMNADWNLPAAEAEFQKAVTLGPAEQRPLNNLAVAAASLGRAEQAVKLLRQSLIFNPLSAVANFNLAQYLTGLGRYDEAAQAIQQAIELQPTATGNAAVSAVIDIQRGRLDAALKEAQQEPDEIWKTYALAVVQYARGDHAAADAALAELIAKHSDDAPEQVAEIYAFRREADKTFEWLDRAYAARDPGALGVLYDPFLLAYRTDPRFITFCKRIGVLQ